MVTVSYDPHFEKTIRKINDAELKERVKQQIVKVINDPSIGKPMRYCRKQTREVYIHPFRLSYWFDKQKDTLVFLAL
jgi:mRNA-degrading endonuclease RelE of RelBE toxin-antitoxin system